MRAFLLVTLLRLIENPVVRAQLAHVLLLWHYASAPITTASEKSGMGGPLDWIRNKYTAARDNLKYELQLRRTIGGVDFQKACKIFGQSTRG